MPFSLPDTFFSKQQTCKHYWSASLRPSPWLSLSLSLSKSPLKSYRGNSQQKIDICLVNSLTTIKDTVSLMIKALMETIYDAEESSTYKKISGSTTLLFTSSFFFFKKWKYIMLLLAQAFLKNGFTAPTQLHTVMSAVIDTEFLSRFYRPRWEKKWLWKQAQDCTSISQWSQGVDNSHSWSKSILKVFLCPQGIS